MYAIVEIQGEKRTLLNLRANKELKNAIQGSLCPYEANGYTP